MKVFDQDRGLALVDAMHITASVFINDDESGLHQDYEDWLEGLAPHEPISRYRHNRTGEDNGDAHLKRQVMGREVVVAVTDGLSWSKTPSIWILTPIGTQKQPVVTPQAVVYSTCQFDPRRSRTK